MVIKEWDNTVQNINQQIDEIDSMLEEMKQMIFIDSCTLCQQNWTISHFTETCKSTIEENSNQLSKQITQIERLLKVS